MLNINNISRTYLFQSGYRGQRLKIVFTNFCPVKRDQTICLFNNWSKIFYSWPFAPKFGKCFKSRVNLLAFKRDIVQVATKESIKESKSNFQQLMLTRRKQAERSVLLQVSKKGDIPYAVAACEKFGTIISAYSYDGENNNSFLLLEFSNETAAKNLLLSCQCKNISDTFPVFSRILQFEKKPNLKFPSSSIDVIEDNLPTGVLGRKASLTDIIQNIYLAEKITELNTRLRYFFCALIKESLSGLFPYCDVLPFGSSVNGIGKRGCDLDVMLRLYPEEVNNEGELYFVNKTCVGDIRALQQKAVFCLGDYIRTFFPGISKVQRIIHARMPILKLKHKILDMDCDVSINNMSAVLMSEVIYFCGEIDFRVRPLLYAVKKWAKDADITYEAPGPWITNFGLTLLVLYFLQRRPVPILPSFNEALVILGEDGSTDYKLQFLKSVDEFQKCASLNEENLAELLEEFFVFLGTYPFKDNIISLMSAKSVPQNQEIVLWIQYPFEESLNITKNVSQVEFRDLCDKARISAKHLENALNQKACNFRDFGMAVGMSNLKRIETKTPRLDVKSIFETNGKKKKK